ncbi:hypothetical protein MKK67_12300 [Methylobacterium sp. J-072]|uniref:hypothetical protein n=1 Tax=Methylobacterium sp. J-072 TaxID=2836651 RepID=UPI001FBA6D50|nr:hypothetical protein [Methylobacterium sp. J-072]MCJ2093264.1 hypothetical protein [Methylobacterium sp. J-072]
MADEALRMQAEVVDRFSGPLKALRTQLLDTGREGAKHGEALAKGLNKAEAAAQATANTAKTVLNPALATLGVTGIGVGVAVAGIANALNSLSGNLSSLGQLGRETGMAADQLRVFQSVAGKFGVSGDASSAAAKTFSQNMRDIRRGVGETMGFLQSQNQVVAQFAIKLKGSKNNDEALKMAEEFMEQIPNAVDRGRFAERLFGNMDLGRLGDKHLGAIKDLNAKTAEKLGPLDPKAVESAERYERALGNLRSSMSKIGLTIASELMVPAERFTTWMDDIASGKRKALIDGLRQGMHNIGAELGAIDWKAAGQSAEQMLTSTTMLVKPLAEGVKEIAAAIKSFNEGKPAEALRHLDGGSGPLARRLAPMKGDDEIDAVENVDKLRKLRDVSKEAAGHLIGRTQQRMGLLDSPEAAQQKLDAAEAELKRLQGRTPEQRQKDYEQSTERLRKSVDNLSEQLKTKQDATAQKSSLDADGLFGDARVQTASLGGARIFGGPGGYGAFSGGNRDAAREAFRQYLMKRVPGYDGGAMVPTGPDGRIPGLGYGMPRLPGVGGGRSSMPGIPDNVPMTAQERNTLGLIMKYESHGQNTMNYMGKRLGLNPMTPKGYTAQGYYQMLNSNWRRIAPGLGITAPNAMSGSLEEQTRVALHLLRNGGVRNWSNYNPALRGALARGEQAPVASVPNIPPIGERPRVASNDPDFFPNGAPRVLKPDSMKDAAGLTMNDAERLRANRSPIGRKSEVLADPNDERRRPEGSFYSEQDDARASRDLGIAFRAMSKRRREMEVNESRLDASAGRAGVLGGTNVEANGSVNVLVQKPGPDTNVRTSASGNLFKDVVLSRGRTMAPAERT